MKKTTNYSKFVASAATATLVASAVIPAASAQDTSFTDVGDRYKEAVNYLVENDITQGLSATEFGTQKNIKRVDVAVLIAKATLTADEISKAPASGFKDVPTRAAKHVNALKAKGIVNGKTASSFGADASITRGEAAIMLSKAYDISGDTANVKFGDVGSRYAEAVAALVDNKITTGKTTTSFGTSQSITRGELAIFLHRLETLEEAPAAQNKVESVKGISGTQVQVNFTDAVNPASLFKNGITGEFKDGALTLSKVGSAPSAGDVTGTLSEDGKTLVVQTENAIEGKYTFILNGLKTEENAAVEKYEKIVTFEKDETAPSLVETNQVNASQLEVVFSEPLSKLGTILYTDENGVVYSGKIENSFASGDSKVLFTLPADLEAGKVLNVKITNAQDVAGNNIAPNPSTTTFEKGGKDGVPPTVGAIKQSGAKQFTVQFSEALASAPTVTVADHTVKSVEKDAANPLKYTVTTEEALNGKRDVTISNMFDLSGEMGEVTSKEVSFNKDATAPVVTSHEVVRDDESKKEYLELTLDKNVNITDNATVSASGEYKRTDAVTVDFPDRSTGVEADADDAAKVRIDLSKLLVGNDAPGAAYKLWLTLDGVTSEADVAVSPIELQFTRGEEAPVENTNTVTVKEVSQDDKDRSKINVLFDKKVDGNTATTLSNYSLTGVVFENVVLKDLVEGTGQVAQLTVKEGGIPTTGIRHMLIKNIKAEGSTKVMENYETDWEVVENIRPTIKKAELVESDEIELTFSEAVQNGEGLDFEVVVDGSTIGSGMNVKLAADDNKKATIKLADALSSTQQTKAIALKPLNTLDIKDLSNNKLKTDSTITVSKK